MPFNLFRSTPTGLRPLRSRASRHVVEWLYEKDENTKNSRHNQKHHKKYVLRYES